MKFFRLAPLVFISTVAATINISAPINAAWGERYTVTWTHDASDPSEFTLAVQLVMHDLATGQLWESTQTKDDKLDVVFENTDPPNQFLPYSVFRLQGRNQSNVDQIYSESPRFQFLAPGADPTPDVPFDVLLSSGASAPASVAISSIESSTASSQSSGTTPAPASGDDQTGDGGAMALMGKTVGTTIAEDPGEPR
ncbi:hypothetical protein BKA70DRAFT_1556389 [Coprinopsis sp. MPI-PUGE-AT-0042]|nr:hypothetical protein BKA70DRAFT_1556389 [Coprinopsis sp. MPI-PUGE-AT-0042]